ncbi:hypothetical protein [Massilia sp. PWRC2]|uniref:hypothetical protein n=1 Tax=Massilia sp. PWRC2 TaxID=2804626 RepID=UPI003CF84015
MNAAKHMEIIFIAALALASVSTLAGASVPAHRSTPIAPMVRTQVSVMTAPGAPMTVVTITAKRLSAAQKAALVN